MSVKNEKLLVVGAGVNQVSIIKTAKEMGCFVIAVTPPGDYPGIMLADEVFYEDIFHKEAILEYAKKRHIDGVISDQSDIIAPTVAYVAEGLGLPGYGYQNALAFTNKRKMRETCKAVGLPVIPSQEVTTLDDAYSAAEAIGYPIIVKPEDSFSSRGVFRVDSKQGLEEKFYMSLKESRGKRVLVEKFISGPQFFSQGFVDEYDLYMFAFSDRYYFNLQDMFIPYTNVFPAKVAETFTQRMTADFQRLINHLRPRFGHVWAEWIYDENADKLYIVEMAIRGAGAFVTSDVIPLAYGIDTQPALIKSALGYGPVHISKEQVKKCAAAFYCFLLPPGVVTNVSGVEELSKIPGVVKTNLVPIKVGDVIEPIANKTSRFGPIIVHGATRDELDDIRKAMMGTLDIRVRTSSGDRGIIWD